jgi:hypothetical protein
MEKGYRADIVAAAAACGVHRGMAGPNGDVVIARSSAQNESSSHSEASGDGNSSLTVSSAVSTASSAVSSSP